MNPDTVHRLVALNRQFYQTLGLSFSSTRQRLQPGVVKVLEKLHSSRRLIDLGCGNGELWRSLARSGFLGRYIGLDFSPQLLQVAIDGPPGIKGTTGIDPQGGPGNEQATFLQVDLSAEDWEKTVPEQPFDMALAFAVLHHLPGDLVRLEVLRKVHQLLVPGGRFFHSEWQFLNASRLRSRIQPWAAAGFSPEEVDPGDYLLDWRHEGYGLRYVHHFDLAELSVLAEASGFHILETFQSDGENGQLGLYQEWLKAEN